ncbi:MAG: lyase family protein, partial [Candidatus Veblenbacteria bacterium]|nr:lyase family protein [Candidatus Veblenbacteria bacterium]
MITAAISPLEGRYAREVAELVPLFSEQGLMRYRLRVEVEYLLALAREPKIREVRPLSSAAAAKLRRMYQAFSAQDARRVSQIEREVTDHDVKALEYFVQEKLKRAGLARLVPFYHFALTSEDVNNIAYTLMLRDGLGVYVHEVQKVIQDLSALAKRFARLPLLAMTHGQPATPTTVGKELAVFVWRLKQQLATLTPICFQAKFSGATGNWSASLAAYPNVNWPRFAARLVESFGLELAPLTTQIEPHDTYAELFDNMRRINTILTDLSQDMW